MSPTRPTTRSQSQSARSSLSPNKSGSAGSGGPAAYSKRAMEIRADEMGVLPSGPGAYGRPAPATLPVGGSGVYEAVEVLQADQDAYGEEEGEVGSEREQAGVDQGYGIAGRRLRAGTMPSRLDPPFLASSNVPSLPSSSSNPSLLSTLTPQRPGIRHAASSAAVPQPSLAPRPSPPVLPTLTSSSSARDISAATLATVNAAPTGSGGGGAGVGNRNRSGSLGLPPSALSSAFASSGAGSASAFGSTWLNPSSTTSTPGQTGSLGHSPLRNLNLQGGLGGVGAGTRAAKTGPILVDDTADPFAAALGGMTSPADSHASLGQGQHFSTLGYLGLADAEGDSGPDARNVHEQGEQMQRPTNGSGAGSAMSIRNRASTVSNFARPLQPSTSASLQLSDEYAQGLGQGGPDQLGDGTRADDYLYGQGSADMAQLSRAMDQMGMYDYDTGEGYYDSTGNAHRPRATTIGPLDNPRQSQVRGYAGGIPPPGPNAYGGGGSGVGVNVNLGPYGTSYLHHQALQGGYHTGQAHGYGVYPPRTRADHLMGTPGPGMAGMGMPMGVGMSMGMGKSHSHSRSRDGGMRHGPRMSGSGHTSRTGTPMQDLDMRGGAGGASTPQMPTRSLWIGNLDVTASQETLLRVFQPYGPIESVRLLPEKTCAFVNYIDRTDAIRARDDVLNRLGGHITELSETAAVRVGFGKIDAAPSGTVLPLSTSTPASESPAPSLSGIPAPAANMELANAALAQSQLLDGHPGNNSTTNGTGDGTSPTKQMRTSTNTPSPLSATAPITATLPDPATVASATLSQSPNFSLEGYGSPSSALATPNVTAHMFSGVDPASLPSSGMVASQAGIGGANPSLGPGQGQGPPGSSNMPTRALWIGSIPGTTSSSTLLQIFSPFGPVESARVLMHKCCGFINFERLDSAVSARNALNGRDILGSDIGAIRIGFARVPTKAPTPVIGGPEDPDMGHVPVAGQGASASSAVAAAAAPVSTSEGAHGPLEQVLDQVKGATSVSTEQQLSVEGGGVENYRSPLVMDLVKAGVAEQVLEKGLAKGGIVSEQQMIMAVLGAGRTEEDGDVKAAAENRPAQTYFTAIPSVTDRPLKRFDVPKLKEHRKRLEAGMSTEEVDEMAMEWIEDSAELSSDHIGNTVVQKLFERVSPPVRFALLERIAPHLATIGIHKNGTWAAQKIIECSTTDAERSMIIAYLRPFAPPLMCDSLGNYVCAGTLKFRSPHADYVFDAMIDRMWDVAQNRFGARCMRTCLESSETSLYQKKRIATSIILNAIPLSTNPNGALLLTWLVDQSGLPGRYGLLANRFAPHIAHLCTHKLASLTVLRIISQTSEPTAAQTLIAGIFASPSHQSLIEILSDANNGAQVIGKIIAVSSVSADEKDKMLEAIRRVMPDIKASGTPPYRHLLEAAGLPIPTSSGPPVVPFNPRSQNAQPGYGPGGRGGWHGPGGRKGSGFGHGNNGNMGMGGFVPGSAHAQGGYGYVSELGLQQQYPGLPPIMIPPMNGGGGGGGGQGLPHGQRRGIDSPRTPIGRQRGRMSPGPSHMMSPGSDPFNPFASPSIDAPYLQAHNMRGPGPSSLGMGATQSMQFEQQPNVGGLGMGMVGHEQYYGQSMMYHEQ